MAEDALDADARAALRESYDRAQAQGLDLVPGALDDFPAFVLQVEKGYAGLLEEYVCGLYSRDALAELAGTLEPGLAGKFAAWLAHWDERLRALTRPVARPPLPIETDPPPWWWLRVPLRPGPQLEKDLSARGLGL